MMSYVGMLVRVTHVPHDLNVELQICQRPTLNASARILSVYCISNLNASDDCDTLNVNGNARDCILNVRLTYKPVTVHDVVRWNACACWCLIIVFGCVPLRLTEVPRFLTRVLLCLAQVPWCLTATPTCLLQVRWCLTRVLLGPIGMHWSLTGVPLCLAEVPR